MKHSLPNRTPAIPASAVAYVAIVHDFTEIYELYNEAISRYCHWKCRDTEIAHDLMQQSFMRFWVCLENNEDIRHARAFLYRVAHNLVVDHIRRKKEASLDVLLEAGFEPAVDPWQHMATRLDSEKWVRKLNTMPTPYRQVLHYRFLQGLPPSEIAALTGETANVVSVRIHRGLKLLRA